MNTAMTTTMDSAGRIVLPKAVREQAGLVAGMPLRVTCRDGRVEIEPAPREIRIVDRGGFRVAEPLDSGPDLRHATVRRVRDDLRAGRKRR